MIYLEEKTSNVSILIENQFPSYVQENNQKFLQFLASYYESQENKYQPLDIASNLVDYYNISYYRPSKLIKQTTLSGNLLKTSTTINVASTDGFPETNGYIQIGNEIIFYRTKTQTSFVDCERGTSALILENIPKSEIFLRNSTASEHKSGVNVVNTAFAYANEFFTRIKSELAPLLPEVLDESLDVTAFIKNIKSFYSAKGSLNSHRILFKILFNDRKFNIKLQSRGSGAKLKINNFAGFIPANPKPEIVSGGSGYDNRKNNSNILINPPVVDIFGSGTGAVSVNGTRPNSTAVIEVTDINFNGEIIDISVVDTGEGYRGPITARVRPRNFVQDQRVYNSSRSGYGRVEYFDAFTNDLILYDVIGYFNPNEELLTDDGEKARAYIAQSFTTPIQSRSGLEVVSESQHIEFPRDYTFKTSDANYSQKKIIRCKLIDGFELQNNIFPVANTLIQEEDKLFGVNGVKIEIDSYTSLTSNIFEFEVSSNSDIADIYLQPTTQVTKTVTGISSSSTNVVITVDDASRFPITNGIISINRREISYKSRSVHQFFNCTYIGSETFDVNIKDEVISYGRIKYDIEWETNQIIKIGDYRFYGNSLYIAETDGITGSTPPSHISGSVLDGSFALGNSDPVLWRYVSSNRFDHTFYIDYNNLVITNPRFQLLAVPGDVVVESGGALHVKTKFEFARFDSPNVDSYNFTTSEISDRLSLVLATNYNRTKQTVTDSRFPSYKSLIGFSNSYDYDDHIYIPSSGIPRWWNDIVDLSQQTLPAADQKKIAFTNQKLICRWKKSGLIYDTQAIGNKRKTKKLLGLNIDAIQVNSYKGNTVEYGFINKFFIGTGGTYPVPYKEVNGISTEVDYDKNPEFILTDGTNNTTVTNQSNLTKISGSITAINFDQLSSLWASTGNLTGYSSKPSIQVINQNPITLVTFNNYTGIDTSLNIITKTNHNLQTTDKVVFRSNGEYFNNLPSGTEYYIRKINNNQFTLHRTNSDALLNANLVSLSYKTVLLNNQVVPAITAGAGFEFLFETEVLNPKNFVPAVLDVSYKDGNIDNILIRESGSGYIQLPKIVITGGGKPTDIEVPFSLNGTRLIELQGPLVSYTNYYRDNNTEIDNFTPISINFNLAPKVTVNNGSGAKAVAYTSNGSIVSMVLIDKGSSYSIPPRVVVTGNGKDAVVRTKINSIGEVIGFDIINGGTGYTVAPRIDIETVGQGAVISARLNEWTFNLVRQLKKYNRIDSYGGYVYDSSDATPSTHNPKNFQLINYDLDFPKDLDKKQYFLINNSDKLLAKYTEEKNPIAINALKQLILQLDPSRNFITNPLTESEIFSVPFHSPAIIISYDGIPIYGGKKVLKERNKSIIIDPTDSRFTTQWTEIKSRYRLKYTEVSAGTSGAITLTTTDGVKYVTVNRPGGPSISEYPIGSFIEDYEYVVGGDNDLDEYNGRFSITPDFPAGRYCYFTTSSSYDPITNALVESAAANNNSIGFNGFPYFIGDSFAAEYDDFMNGKCRTNDKIPAVYTRSFEKDIDSAPLIGFPGLPHNDEYPQEKINTFRTIANSSVISRGSIDSVIIESKGNNYRVGDRLDVDNTLTAGSGFSAFISRVGGKPISEISKTSDYKTATFKTSQQNGLKIGDYIYFDYADASTQVQVNLHGNVDSAALDTRVRRLSSVEVSLQEGLPVDIYKDKEVYTINLNFKYVYQLNIVANSEFKLTYDIDAVNEFFTLEESPADSVILTAKNIPNRLYLHVNNYIYELNKTTDYFGTHRVFSVDPLNNKFVIKFPESTLLYEQTNLIYTVKSYGATGPIEEVSISNPGYNYRKLPSIRGIIKQGTTNEVAGDGKAIIQANSNTIGSIKNVSYASIGESFTSNKNVNYYLNISSTAKVINNFEIYDVEIIDGGQLYDNVVEILVNGESNLVVLRATVNIGTITDIEVVDGGAFFSEIPTLTVVSQQGSGAVLQAKIRRKKLYPDAILKGTNNSQQILSKLYPVQVETSVVNFDDETSTLEFDERVGQFTENDVLYTFDGKPYGRIVSIRRSRAYAKVNAYAKLQPEKIDISGNTSESLQKITDSNYYQDWSYSIVSSRDTTEWKKDQNINTHAAGFKQFGKKVIERRKSFFDNPADVFKSSVIFTTNIVNTVDLNVKLSPCRVQKIFFQDPSAFIIGNYVYGTTSGAIGEVIDKTDYFVSLRVRNNINFQVDEVVISVRPEYAFGVLTGTSKSLAFWNGLFQEPGESYDISAADPVYTGIPETFVPKFTLENTDSVIVYRTTTEFVNLDTQTLPGATSTFSFSVDGTAYNIDQSNLEQFIISIGGSVQNPNNLTVSNNIVNINEPLTHSSTVFAVQHEELKKLTFTGSGTTYTINYTPADDCNLVIFHEGAFQAELLTDFTLSGNTVVFDESVNINNIFGWYIDETVECELVDVTNINKNKALSIIPCVTKNFTESIESNAVKTPESLYEIRKETIDGTVYPTSSTLVTGFDTKFTYTSPKYSSSYVEVLDRISFNGSTKTFALKTNGESYTPSNGKESLVVYINNTVLDQDQYSVAGTNITFVQTYTSTQKCTVVDYVSSFLSNTNDENGTILDRLNVVQNGTRKTFNLSDRGVPKYVNNVGDIFTIKNGLLTRPDAATHSINDNKITFLAAPLSTDNVKLAFFNRQLLPEPTKNVILDPLRCFDGSRTSFPITVNGILLSPITVNHLFIIRNGVLQKPGIDYTLSGGHNIVFATAPEDWEIIFSFYSYDGLNQNIVLNIAKYFDGVRTSFALTQNYQSTTVLGNQNTLVFRNGVYQYPSTDYTINDQQTGPYITFGTVPVQSDEIFITNLKQTLVDATSYFSQIASNQIQSSAPNGTYDDSIFLIFVNGLLQVGNSWSYSSGVITFNLTVSLTLDKVKVYAFTSAKRELDSIAVTNTSTLTYNLNYSSSQINNVSKASDLIVSIEGVVQEPEVAYTVTSGTITFNTTALYQSGIDIYIYQVGDTSANLTERIDYLNDNYLKTTETVGGVSIDTETYKLLDGFKSFNPPSVDDIFIIRNGVVQNPTEDFSVGNGFITFTTNIDDTEDIFILYTHGAEERSISSSAAISSSVHRYTLSVALASNEYNDIIVYADGVPRFYQRNDFTVENNDTEIHLTHTDGITPTQVFVMKYPSVIVVDEYEDCPDGVRTRFKLLYNNQNLVISDTVTDADILISINGIVQHPGTQYTLTANRGFVDMSYAPQFVDEIFMVRMNGNLVRNLTPTGLTRQYALSVSEPSEKENVVVFSNNTWKFAELGDFTWNNDSTITLSSAHTSGNLFAIKFYGVFNLLDQIHTPYNGVNTKFNLFDIQENFVPVGTVDNDNNPDETSLLVVKNGKILDPKVDYTLTGDAESQIVFTTAPILSDIISVRSVGSFDKLDTINNGSNYVFNIRKSGVDYYPNGHIDRPREHENQILVIVDGNVMSPLYDYFVYNNLLTFENTITFTKMVILDFRGTSEDVKVYNRFNQVTVGDEIKITGEDSPRKVTEVLSPTVLKTQNYTGNSPSGFAASTTIVNGKINQITVSSQGLRYKDPIVLRTLGTGTGAKAIGLTNQYIGGGLETGEILYYGHNVYNTHYVFPTVYALVEKKQPLSKSQIRKGTKLSSNINASVETIPLANTFELPSNTPTVTVSSSSGNGASFKVFISCGELRKIEILSGGSGYDDRDIELELTGGGGTGCVLEPVLNGSGTITDVIIRNPGVGYDTFRVIVHNVDGNNIVNAEVIEYTYMSQSGIDGCTRGVLGDAASHLQNDIVYFDSYL